MKWTIHYEMMEDQDANEKASLVINDIVEEFERLIPKGPPLGYKPLHLINDRVAGPTIYWPLGKDFYKIGLNISNVFFNQVAFQFSQEFCRIYCDPRISNWFIQLMNHVAALYFLDYLNKKWEHDPPMEELKDYHENFSNYRSNLLGTAFSRIDMVKYQISNEWVKNQVKKLINRETYNRGKMLIVAYEILGLFQESDANWQMLPYIGRCSVPAPPGDPKDVTTIRKTDMDFNRLIDAVPKEIKPFVQKLVDKFGVMEEEGSE
ncbi:MAG: hypothetical protein KGY60_00275 [Bacteroidales bacterium]|nr:hypothetical protein [Bacteroidales bacterium]